jgi:hypothetical protein
MEALLYINVDRLHNRGSINHLQNITNIIFLKSSPAGGVNERVKIRNCGNSSVSLPRQQFLIFGSLRLFLLTFLGEQKSKKKMFRKLFLLIENKIFHLIQQQY